MATRLVPIKRKATAQPMRATPVKRTNLIDRVQRDMAKQGIVARTAASRKWLLGIHQELRPNPTRLINNQAQSTKTVPYALPGFMYFFNYDPKHKETLPYYDRYPLIICVKRLKDGFHGLNLHYLPPMQRALLLTQLEDVASKTTFDANTKLNISYRILVSYSKFAAFRPCFKRYLSNHVRSPYLFIPSQSWDTAVFLPLARFEKKTQQQVWYGR